MKKPFSRTSKYALSLFVFVLALSLTLGMAYGQADHSQNGLTRAIEAQDMHTERLMAISGVVGTGTGIGADGEPVIRIYTTRAGIPGIPRILEGFPVEVKVTGKIVALGCNQNDPDPKQYFPRPVPIGVSTGHPDITAGTIGCRVKDTVGNVYALSNNHVYANENLASIVDDVLQPGPYDGGGADPTQDDAIGTLHDFEDILFCKPRGPLFYSCPDDNTIDAAIALLPTPATVGVATPTWLTPKSTVAAPALGMEVQKYGRTTCLTTGEITAINVTVNVGYSNGVARFVNQIQFENDGAQVIRGGDSGSLLMTSPGLESVGLVFAGNAPEGTVGFANEIQRVLDRFAVSVDDGSSADNIPPTADFTFTTNGLTVNFTDTSSDPDADGSVVAWNWNFGDGNTSTARNPSHTYAASDTYPVTLTVTDDDGATDSRSKDVTVTGGNTPPTADFTFTTNGLTVNFTDTSSDPDADGSVVAWNWNFGDGNTSTAQNPSHTYAASDTYPVTLTVTDDDGATDSRSKDVAVSDGSGGITLTATGYKVRGRQKADLEWSGATSEKVDIYRDGALLTTTENDGSYTDNINNRGGGSYTYQVCEEGRTSTCSSEATVTF